MTNIDPTLLTQLKQLVYTPVSCLIEVRNQLGPFLNEYMYQDALAIEFAQRGLPFQKEYYFSINYKGEIIQHKHYVDFLFGEGDERMLIECKAIGTIGSDQRQQLWNYMRLTGIKVGILYNFAPVKAQIERYYLPDDSPMMQAF